MFTVCLRRNSRRPSAVKYIARAVFNEKTSTTDFGNADHNWGKLKPIKKKGT